MVAQSRRNHFGSLRSDRETFLNQGVSGEFLSMLVKVVGVEDQVLFVLMCICAYTPTISSEWKACHEQYSMVCYGA